MPAEQREDFIKISIHAPLRERLLCPDYYLELSNFNPRSLAGATCSHTSENKSKKYFNPRSLAGATALLGPGLGAGIFQSTLPCGSDAALIFCLKDTALFQSTLPCGSDDSFANFGQNMLTISIHAPLRERQELERLSNFDTCISIHAPLRERQADHKLTRKTEEFQSTLPCGSDKSINLSWPY